MADHRARRRRSPVSCAPDSMSQIASGFDLRAMFGQQRAVGVPARPRAQRQEDLVDVARSPERPLRRCSRDPRRSGAGRRARRARGGRAAGRQDRATTPRARLGNRDRAAWRTPRVAADTICGSRPSAPAITLSRNATSDTERAIGPFTDTPTNGIWVGAIGTRPTRRPQRDDVVEVGGIAERAAEVAAIGDRQHARRERRRRAAARSAGALGPIVRIHASCRRPCCRCATPCRTRARWSCRSESRRRARIRSTITESASGIRSLKIGEPLLCGKPTAGSRSLNAIGRPCSGPTGLAVAERAIGGVGQRQARVVIEPGDDGVELGIESRDLREKRRHHFARRHLARANLRRERRARS